MVKPRAFFNADLNSCETPLIVNDIANKLELAFDSLL